MREKDMWKCTICETKNNDETFCCSICQTKKENSIKYAEKMKESNKFTTIHSTLRNDHKGSKDTVSSKSSIGEMYHSMPSAKTKPYFDESSKLKKTTESAIHPIRPTDLGKSPIKPVDDFRDIDSLKIKKKVDEKAIPVSLGNSGLSAKSIIAALVGGIPGIVLWILAGLAGYIWSLFAFVIAFGTFWAFEKVGGKTTNKKSIIICTIIIALELYVGVHLLWSISICRVVENNGANIPFYKFVMQLYEILKVWDLTEEFVSDLIKSYLFGIIGCFRYIRKLWDFKKK